MNRNQKYQIFSALELLFKAFEKQRKIAFDDKWITIGAGKNDWGESIGRHVKIDEHGNIIGGSLPKSAQGKPINSWWKESDGVQNNSTSRTSKNKRTEEIIKKYGLDPIWSGPNAGKLMASHRPETKKEMDEIKAHVQEIKKYFIEKKAAEESERKRRKNNVASIPGLKEIRDLQNANEEWRYSFNKSIESGRSGAGVGPKPQGDIDSLLKKYPQAAAYLKVESESEKSNYELASIGKKALSEFEDDPSKWKEVISKMGKSIHKFVSEHQGD